MVVDEDNTIAETKIVVVLNWAQELKARTAARVSR